MTIPFITHCPRCQNELTRYNSYWLQCNCRIEINKAGHACSWLYVTDPNTSTEGLQEKWLDIHIYYNNYWILWADQRLRNSETYKDYNVYVPNNIYLFSDQELDTFIKSNLIFS